MTPFLLPQKPCIQIPVKCQSVEDIGYKFIQLHIKPIVTLNKLSVKNTEHVFLSDRPSLDNYNYITTQCDCTLITLHLVAVTYLYLFL